MPYRPLVSRPRALVIFAALALAASSALAAGQSWTAGMSSAPVSGAEEPSAGLRLVRASYEVDVLGPVAVGVLVQEFLNESDQDLKATYGGQAPLGLRVASLEAEFEGETVNLLPSDDSGQQGRKGSARQAKQAQRSAPKPKQLTVEAGQLVKVRAGFETTLSLSEGHFMLRLPAVGAAGEEATGVPGGIAVTVHHDAPLLYAESPSHEVFVSYQGDNTLIELVGQESESREFKFEFAMGSEDDATLMSFAGPERDGVRDLVVVLTPPPAPRGETVRPKQLLFVLDTSGSMAKGKLDQARVALASCLDKLRPEDQFNIVEFDASFSLHAEQPVRAIDEAPGRAKTWLMSQRPGGGTRMLPALAATLEQREELEHHRMIVVLTDGALQDTAQVLELLKQSLGEGRLFVVGIGEDVNRKSILSLAEYGRGTAVFASDPEGLEGAIAQLFDSISEPLAWDLQLDWGEAQVEVIRPKRLPDLYGGRPVTVFARVRGELPSELKVEAATMGGTRLLIAPVTEAGLSRLPRPSREIDAPRKR